MQKFLASIVLLSVLLSPSIRAQEARSIFDGKSLAGWEGESGFWSVESGELVGRSTAAHPLPHSTWLLWRGGEVSDFRLDLDFKLIGGNSGVQFRSRDLGKFQVGGYQADLEDGPSWSGCLYEQEGRGVCAQRGQSVVFNADGTKTVLEVADGAKLLEEVHARDWNHYTIVARGASMSFAINGVPMTTVTDLDAKRFAAKGILALQLHQGPPMEVRYKNIQLTDLTGKANSAGADDPNTPKWIWTRAESKQDKQAFFERRFDLAKVPRAAKLSGCADNELEVSVNAVSVLDHDEWEKPVFVDVAKQLRAGANVISVHAKNDGGPAAIQLSLELEFEDGSRQRIVTDTSWMCSDGPIGEPAAGETKLKPWTKAVSVGALGTGVWGSLPKAVKYDPPRALAAEEIVAPAGVKVELVYTVPRKSEGSWVSMCFDDRGRMVASDQYGSLYRVTLDRGAWQKTERLDLPIGSAHGLCFAFDALYVVVAASGDGYEPGLWRAKYFSKEDRFEKPVMLQKFDGDGEHGPHAVMLSPDKKSLFVVGGNHTAVPEPLVRTHVVPSWGEDQLLPQHADPNGHAVGITAPGGWIAKCDPEGKNWELFASGFRNAYDMAFDFNGEAFTFDSDMEWDMGLPWYRPTMIQHVVPGGDYGWRTGSWRWPAYYPDSLPGALDIGASSPTGMCFIPPNANLALGGGKTLLVGDWAYGRIIAVALDPKGSTYDGSFEVFLEGKPLPVTDMSFGPDGAFYFLVGGRRTQSALYRVTGKTVTASVSGKKLGLEAAALATARRNHAASYGDSNNECSYADVLRDIDSSDRFLRYAARTAIEHQIPSRWIEAALAEKRPWASIEALIAVARRAPSEWRDKALEHFDALPLESMDEEHTLASLRALELIFVRLGKPTGERALSLAMRLDALYPSKITPINRELCQLLVSLEAPNVASKTLKLIDLAKTPADQIALAWSLRNLHTNWSLPERTRYFRWMNETTAGWSGGLSFTKYLDNLRDDTIANLSPEEHRLLGGLVDKPRAVEASATKAKRELVKQWAVDDLLAAAVQARHDRNFDRGRNLFREARCYDCHRINNTGGGSGPDLTGAGSRFGDRDLLEALLDPSKVISDQYQDSEVLTSDDRMYVGRMARVAGGDVHILEVDAKEPRVIPAAEVVTVRPSKVSRMPKDLLDTFSEDELIDLIAYLRSGGDSKDAAYGSR